LDRSIYVGTDQGLFLSPDAGSNWEKVLPYGVQAITEGQSHEIYASTWFGVFKSSDGGQRWHQASLGLPVRMDRSPTSTASPNASVHDFGLPGDVYVFTGDPIYVAGRGGYWTTSDWGLSWAWHAVSTDLSAVNAAGVLSPKYGANMRQLFETKERMLFLSLFEYGNVRSEADFVKVQAEGKAARLNPNNAASMIGMSPLDSQVLYMTGGGGSQPSPRSGIFLSKSEDGGFSWHTFDLSRWLRRSVAGSAVIRVPLFVVSPQSSRTCYAFASLNTPQHTDFALLKTLDGGDTWLDIFPEQLVPVTKRQQSRLEDLVTLVVDPSNDRTVYLSLNDTLFKTTDGGERWAQLPISAGRINDIAVNPKSSSVVYLASDSGMWVSRNGGTSWGATDLGLFEDRMRKVVLADATVLAEGYNGVYRLVKGDADFGALKSRWEELEREPESDPLSPKNQSQ
jgi:hypothetical protein